MKQKHVGPKILLFDIETSPLLVYVWGLWDNNVSLNQIVEDWSVLSWSAKWLEKGPYAKDDKTVMYEDVRKQGNIRNDKKLLKQIWKLLDEADIVITQNGKSFDSRKLNAKFEEHKLGVPSSYRHIDTKILAQKHFNLPSYKLEYMAGKYNKKYKKLVHREFPGQELWNACLLKNQKAWKCMEKYNKHDVLALEELYHVFAPWGTGINFNVYHEGTEIICQCGSTQFVKNGKDYYTNTGRYQRYKCKKCGDETRAKINILSKEKRQSLRMPINR